MNYVRVKSYAKVNLSLDIKGAQNGFHILDSVVASIDVCDVITAKKRNDKLISVTMHGEGSEYIPYGKNNAAAAAELFVGAFGTCGADITVWKNIPMGAGLGGSSADVAGVLRAMAKLYGVGYSGLKPLADKLGSDCGYMLTGGYARISGRGEIVKTIDSDLKLYVGLVKCAESVNTGECYAAYDKLKTRGEDCSDRVEEALLRGDLCGLGASLNNKLLPAACSLCDKITNNLNELKGLDPLGVNMTGSGSAVYAIFENDQFLSYARSRYRGGGKFIAAKTIIPARED